MTDRKDGQDEELVISPDDLDSLEQSIDDSGEVKDDSPLFSGEHDYAEESDTGNDADSEDSFTGSTTYSTSSDEQIVNRKAGKGMGLKIAVAAAVGVLAVGGGVMALGLGGGAEASDSAQTIEQPEIALVAEDSRPEERVFLVHDDEEVETSLTLTPKVPPAAPAVTEEDLLAVKEQVALVASGVAEMQEAVAALESSDSGVAELKASVDGLVEALDSRLTAVEARMDGMRNDIKLVAGTVASVRKAAQDKEPIKPTVNGPSKALVAQYRTAQSPAPKNVEPLADAAPVAPATVIIPPSRPVPAPRVPQANPAPEFGSCKSDARISQVWRVSGANQNMAHLFRANDNFSMMVRLGSEVPGFGVIQAIDVASRSVCTTSGIIQR